MTFEKEPSPRTVIIGTPLIWSTISVWPLFSWSDHHQRLTESQQASLKGDMSTCPDIRPVL